MAEKFVRYGTIVEDLPSAWSYVMGKIDEFPIPNITIQGVTAVEIEKFEEAEETGEEPEWADKFEVTVYGNVEEPDED